MMYSVRRVANHDNARGGREEINGRSTCARTGYESTKKAERNSTQRETSLESS